MELVRVITFLLTIYGLVCESSNVKCGIGVNWWGMIELEDIVSGANAWLFSHSLLNFDSITANGHDPPFYMVGSSKSNPADAGILFKYDPCTSHSLVTIGYVKVSSYTIRALAFNPNNGLLYASYDHGNEDHLYSIDPMTATPTLIGKIGVETSIQGMEFDEYGVLYSYYY